MNTNGTPRWIVMEETLSEKVPSPPATDGTMRVAVADAVAVGCRRRLLADLLLNHNGNDKVLVHLKVTSQMRFLVSSLACKQNTSEMWWLGSLPNHHERVYDSRMTLVQISNEYVNMNRIWPAPKDVTYIFLPRKIENFSYETSFLKHRKLIIDGDVESNPGPFSSIEAYRSAVGRFSGKSQLRGKVANFNGMDLTFCLFKLLFLSVLLYALFIGIMITYCAYILHLLAILIANSYFLYNNGYFRDSSSKDAKQECAYEKIIH